MNLCSDLFTSSDLLTSSDLFTYVQIYSLKFRFIHLSSDLFTSSECVHYVHDPPLTMNLQTLGDLKLSLIRSKFR